MRRLHNIGRLFTGTQAGVIQKAAIICDDDEHIAWCGREGARTTKTAAAGS